MNAIKIWLYLCHCFTDRTSWYYQLPERLRASSGLQHSPSDHLVRRTINLIHGRCCPLNLSAAPTHHCTGMSYRGAHQRSECVRSWGICVSVCVCVSQTEGIPKPRPMSVYTTLIHHYTSPSDSSLMTAYICPHKHFSRRSNTRRLYVDTYVTEKEKHEHARCW